MLNISAIIEILATGTGVIAGAVQVIDYIEKKKSERHDKQRWSAPPPGGNPPTDRPVPMRDAAYETVPQQTLHDPGAAEGPAAESDAVFRSVKRAKSVVILYKRGIKNDTHVLELLEAELHAANFRVFIDKHIQIGVAWAAEIEQQIKDAEAVIALLSEQSAHSEMVEYEVQAAYNAAALNNGAPRILPVRINFEEPLAGTIGAILSPLHFTRWAGPDDDSRVVFDILRTLRGEALSSPEGMRETVGGAVPLDSGFYVVRPTDALFVNAIRRHDSIVLVKGARQIGKTSLLARGLQDARKSGVRIVLEDLQTVSARELESPDALFQAFSQNFVDQLGIEGVSVRKSWDPERGPNSNFERFLRKEVLERSEAPIVWGLDEVDRLFTCPFSSEVFGLFRSWHNRRSLDPDTPWARLTLAMAYATEAHLFITDINQSPFNVGTRLTLDDFIDKQVADLNQRYGCPIAPTHESEKRFINLVGGQPYLVRRGLSFMADEKKTLDQLIATASSEDGIYGDHLRRILITLSLDEKLLSVVRKMVAGGAFPDEDSFYRLRTAGLISGQDASVAHFRCGLYREYLSKHL